MFDKLHTPALFDYKTVHNIYYM